MVLIDNSDKIDVLLVDDRKDNLLALEVVLAGSGYNLIRASSGEEALRILLDHSPAVILMDVQMPGLSGFETAAIIKSGEKTREIPIVFITAFSKDESFVRQAYEYGAVDYIYKPYDAQVLKSKVAVFAEIRRQHVRVARLVAVQRAATHALADSTNVDDSVSNVLRSLCVSLEWDVGLFWVYDRRTQLISCQSEWQDPSHDNRKFISESFKRQYAPGIGLPGRVLSSRSALWLTDVGTAAGVTRQEAAAENLMVTEVIFPVRVADEVMGVIEVFSRKRMIEDPDLVKIMEAIGTQIGQILKREEALRWVKANEAHQATILETALDCIVSIDHLGRITSFNPAAEKAFGYSRLEIVGHDVRNVIVLPGCQERYQEGYREEDADRRFDFARFLSGRGAASYVNRRIEGVGVRSDGSRFDLELAITPTSTIEPPGFTAFLRDITLRKRNEENTLFLGEATTTLSASLNYDESFPSLAKLVVRSFADFCVFGVFGEGGTVRTVAVAHRDPARVQAISDICERFPADWAADEVIRAGKSAIYSDISDELLLKRARDSEHFRALRGLGMNSLIIVPLIVRGETLGVITFVSTEQGRRYTQDDLAVADELGRRAAIAIDNTKLYRDAQDAIRVRDEFFSIASHELKMLLQLTQRGVNIEEGMVPSAPRMSKMLDTSMKQVDQLTHLIEDLLDVVKIRAGKLSFSLEEFNLSELVRELAERYTGVMATANCPLELDLAPGVVGVWDRTRIEQIVVNLISNAIKYAPGGPIKIKVLCHEGVAELTVFDSGPGVAPDQQARVFERFERAVASRNITGLGLGLFIVKQIVEAHHGSVRIDSQKGRGSAFIVELPIHPPEAPKESSATSLGPQVRANPLADSNLRQR